MWAEKNKHFRDFVWSFQFNSLLVWHVGARGARERGSERVLPVFSHSSLQIPLWTPWALTVTLFYPPWIINPSFFEEPSMGTRALGSLFILGEEESLRSLSVYPSCYPFKDKTSFDLSFRKLIETAQLVVSGQEGWQKDRKLEKAIFCISCQQSHLLSLLVF